MAAVRRNSGSINSEDSDNIPAVEGYVYSGYLINTAKLEPSMTTLERTTDNVTNTVVFPPDNSKSGNFKSTAEFETNISSNALVTKVEPSKPILNLSSPKDEKTITTFGNNINNHVNLAGDKSIVSPTQSKYDTSRDPMRMMNTCNNNNIPPVSDITTNVQSQRPKPNTNIQPSFLDNQQIPSNVDNYMNEYSLNTSLSPRSNNYVSPLRNTSNFSEYNPRPYYNPHPQRRNNNLHKQTEDMLRKRISILEEENKQLKLDLQKLKNTTIQPSSESPSEKESTKKDSGCTKHPEMYVCVDCSAITTQHGKTFIKVNALSSTSIKKNEQESTVTDPNQVHEPIKRSRKSRRKQAHLDSDELVSKLNLHDIKNKQVFIRCKKHPNIDISMHVRFVKCKPNVTKDTATINDVTFHLFADNFGFFRIDLNSKDELDRNISANKSGKRLSYDIPVDIQKMNENKERKRKRPSSNNSIKRHRSHWK